LDFDAISQIYSTVCAGNEFDWQSCSNSSYMPEAFGLYVSIPFCRSKCSYCNFASGVYPANYMPRYVERLVEDLRAARGWANRNEARLPDKIDSIYLGGGTPSLLPPALLTKLFATIRSEFEVTINAEITLECAPGQVDDRVLAAMIEAGVNRVSFGVQSFVDREAAVTGRLHTTEIALVDIGRMRQAGICSINVDLIAGLPHQTCDSWRESLAVLADSGVNHASVYMFEIDDDSRLGREMLIGGGRYHAGAVPGEDEVAEFYVFACEFLERQGLAQYEISNFSRLGEDSQHNLKYWLRQPYLGLGVDAHSMLRTKSEDVLRFSDTDDLQQYLNGRFDPELLRVSPDRQLEEAWFLGLRLNRGVNLEDLAGEFGPVDVRNFDGVIEEMREAGLLEVSGKTIRLTGKGRLLSNEVFERFLLENSIAASV
jgi:oxygen-independent coproporphyrinogen-3 oxidase